MGWVWYDWLGAALFVLALAALLVYAYLADERDAREEIRWCPVCEENLPVIHEAHRPVA